MNERRLVGRRVRLLSTSDPHARTSRPERRPRSSSCNDLATIHVAWDDGCQLDLFPGEDHREVI
jgi:hypothetical protein